MTRDDAASRRSGAVRSAILAGGLLAGGLLPAEAAEGIASFYGRREHGGPTASGERFDMHAMTAAHRTAPIGSHMRVTNLRNGQSVVVRINDRGPFVRGRIIDLSHAAAARLDFIGSGLTRVAIEQVEAGATTTKIAAAAPKVEPSPAETTGSLPDGERQRHAARAAETRVVALDDRDAYLIDRGGTPNCRSRSSRSAGLARRRAGPVVPQRSAVASLAPSATKAAAKPRRIQASTPGRVITRSRTEAANSP